VNFFTAILGKTGLLIFIGMLAFFMVYKNSIKLFQWIEDQTYGTREYILQKCELLYFSVEPKYVTYALLYLAFGNAVIIFSLFAITGKVGAGLVLGAIASLIGWKFPRPFMDFLVNQRIKKFSDQMVDALNLLSNGLRAGLSLPQSCGMVVDELPKPVSQEFNTILQQTKIGVPLEEAFENFAKRVPTQDNDMFVTSISILRETGGNLAEVFDTITDVIRERVRLKQKIDTFVAQGKFQGGFIFFMPFAMFGVNYASDPKSVEPLVSTAPGIIALIIALGLTFLGGFIMLKIIDIKL
jgi:tight adherence protein B